MSRDHSDMDRLKAYAEAHRLTVHESSQFGLIWKVGIFGPDAPSRAPIITRDSYESYDQAAFYLINALGLLGVEISR